MKNSETENPAVTHDNPVDAKNELRDAIVAYFKKSFQTEKEITGTFVVWVSDSRAKYQDYVRKDEFKNDLYTELDNRQLNAVSKAKIEFKTENPPREFETIAEGVCVQFLVKGKQTENPKDVCTKAQITVMEGKGSLMKSKYILDADKYTEYDIGRGSENNRHIVIKENDPEYGEINNRVSRQHARIVFVAGKGFALESLKFDNRTFIHRAGKREHDIYLNDGARLLKHNDIIELGKSVCLLFEVIDDNKKMLTFAPSTAVR